MARSRNIKPGFFQNEVLADMPPLVRLLFAGLWTIADREGRIEDRARRIKVAVMPYDEINVDEALDILATAPDPFIIRYEIDGARYIQITKWHEHQKPHHMEIPSQIPAFSVDESCTNRAQVVHEPWTPRPPVKGISVKGISNKESEGGVGEENFAAWWSTVPNKIGKQAAAKAYRTAVKAIRNRPALEGGGGDDPHGFLLARMLAFAQSPKARSQFCPHPSTWLNEGRYDDDPETWKSNGNEFGRRSDIGPGQRHDPVAAKSRNGVLGF